MRVLVLFSHPCEESFGAALHACAVETLRKAGHEVDDCDLYAEDFQPVLTAAERRAYHDTARNQDGVAPYVERLQRADALVIVTPIWNYGFPAILKGFFDRVFLPGVSFTLVDGKVQGNLHNITKVVAVTTYGGSHLKALLMSDPPRRVVTRMLRAVVKPFARFRYLAHYSMNLSTDSSRAAFLAKVERTLAGI
ncbi:NAD(P)H dehydrogenase [Labrys sp. WJW]|jgi:putative NADPH-quinone reductase|uniref:NAD(P)H-dependent oxidoreductase n=1 Tax=Labrys sp. WJW TaxID=1737983 RepID=UPI0008336961|nr:NAD(P)H-dependent oxidoreductase [Labrys sp. WJW]OCC05049.1 NAD(P)H dehydrogenase [Labrys sp. WJW]